MILQLKKWKLEGFKTFGHIIQLVRSPARLMLQFI